MGTKFDKFNKFNKFMKRDFDVTKNTIRHEVDKTKDYTTNEALLGLASVFYCKVYYAQILQEFRELVKIATDDDLIDFFKKLDVFEN